MPYTVSDKIYCRRAAECLGNAFVWSNSPEGGSFWQAVHDRLAFLAAGRNFDRPCFEDMKATFYEAENKRLTSLLELQQVQMEQLRADLARTRKKLIASDFINYGR